MATILLVEDDDALAQMMRADLEQAGFEVVYAGDGEAALTALRIGEPDLMLLDILLPKRSGFDILEELRRDPALAHPPVIVLSSSGEKLELNRAKELGALDYIVKGSTSREELIQKIMTFLQDTTPQSAGEAGSNGGAAGAVPTEVPPGPAGPAPAPSPALAEPSTTSEPSGGMSVLVVEDDKFLRDLIVQKLKREQFNVFEAVTGSEALRVAKESQPMIILLDLILPGLDGFEVLKRLKEDTATAQIPIIILSNLGQREDVERGLRLGAVDFMIKAHFTPGEIVDKIKELLSQTTPPK